MPAPFNGNIDVTPKAIEAYRKVLEKQRGTQNQVQKYVKASMEKLMNRKHYECKALGKNFDGGLGTEDEGDEEGGGSDDFSADTDSSGGSLDYTA